MAFHDVHAPLECPAAYFDPKTAGTPRQNVQGMVRCVSLATGNITDAIKAKGLWANSLFIWSADNGGPQFEAMNNYPLRTQSPAVWRSASG